MSSIVHYDKCPACDAAGLANVLRVKDFSVSGEEFDLVECPACSLRITQDAPAADRIAPYYKSEAYISHSNTRKGLINRIYHMVRNRTLEQKRKWVEEYTGLKQGSLLDVGAGVGAFLREMHDHGWEATGLEPDADAREVARTDNNVVLEDNSMLYHLEPGRFHAITLWHVLEHVHDLEGYVRRFSDLLAPGGVLMIAVPNYTSADAQYYGKYWAAWDVPRHLYHFSPNSMRQLLGRHGLDVVQQLPMRYDAYYVSLLSNRYKTGRSSWLKAIWQGLKSNKTAGRSGASSIVYVAKRTF